MFLVSKVLRPQRTLAILIIISAIVIDISAAATSIREKKSNNSSSSSNRIDAVEVEREDHSKLRFHRDFLLNNHEFFPTLDMKKASVDEENGHSSGSSSSDKRSTKPFRDLQIKRECNELITVTTTDELAILAQFFVTFFVEGLGGTVGASAMQLLESGLKYDIAVSKVCLSCADIVEMDLLDDDNFASTSKYGFPSYCSPTSYGYRAQHSALVFAPIDPSTGMIFEGNLRGFVASHSTQIETDTVPSNLWPESVLEIGLDDFGVDPRDNIFRFRDTFAAAFAASAGAISVLPDYIGFGESTDFDRTYVANLPYMQAHVVSYLAARRYLLRETDGCTLLGDVATATGYSEGGYAAVVGALALEKIGVKILSVHAGGTPWDVDTQLQFQLSEFLRGRVTISNLLVSAFGAYAFSNENLDFLANAGTGVILASKAFSDPNNPSQNIIEWFSAPDTASVETILLSLPTPVTDILNPNFLNLLVTADATGIQAPCTDGSLVSESLMPLCDAILESSLLDALQNDIRFPLHICHSPDDELVGIVNVPDLDALGAPSNVQIYEPIIPELAPDFGHGIAFILCQLAPIFEVISNLDAGRSSNTHIGELPRGQCFGNNAGNGKGSSSKKGNGTGRGAAKKGGKRP